MLRRRAAAAHQSLQEYLLTKLVGDAAVPTLGEIADEIEAGWRRRAANVHRPRGGGRPPGGP